MQINLVEFEAIVRRVDRVAPSSNESGVELHPFDTRNIHPGLCRVVRDLFDNGHYAQATFEAFKFIDNEVARHSNASEFGKRLMMRAFSETSPKIQLNRLATMTDRDEQEGFKFLFAGGMLAIRNPRGHEHAIHDDPDACLDHLTFASMLLRRLADAGYR